MTPLLLRGLLAWVVCLSSFQVQADPIGRALSYSGVVPKWKREPILTTFVDDGAEGEVRVVSPSIGGSTDDSLSGRLEIYHDGIWGTVCDDRFEHLEAMVACRQLGYAKGEALGVNFEPGEGPIWMDEVHCSQRTSSLAQCRFAGWGTTDCTHREDVAIVCSERITVEMEEEEGAVRLVGGGEWEDFIYGRLEIYHLGLWGSVCDDSFNEDAAQIVCRQLGYSHGAVNFYGAGGGMIWLDEVSCPRRAASLLQCDHAGWGQHDCDHSEDVGVSCEHKISE